MYLLPAFGDRYQSEEEARQAWENGRDFRVLKGPYCSNRDESLMVEMYGYIEIIWNYPCVPAGMKSILVAGEKNMLDVLLGYC
jgi:hypothetical protein